MADPTTSAYIDPNTLNISSAENDGIPILGVGESFPPTKSSVPPTLGSHNPFAGAASDPVGPVEPVIPVVPITPTTAHSTATTGTTGTGSSFSPPPSAATTGSGQSKAPASTSSTSTSTSAKSPTATGLRQRVGSLSQDIGTKLDDASKSPAVQNAKDSAQKQVGNFREILGRSPLIVNLEKRTNVDRVFLVVGAVLTYIILIPLNLFGLALPTTTALTLVPPSLLALGILERPSSSEKNEAATRSLLAYFVTLGFVHFLESLAAGLLERRIPQYYTVKLLFLAYLLHPRTQGAMQLHNAVYRPLLAHAQHPTPLNTPPQTNQHSDYSSSSSPTTYPLAGATGPTGSQGNKVHLPSGPGSGVGMDINKTGAPGYQVGTSGI